MAPALGAWGRVCAGVIWRKNVAEASNDVRLEPITFDLLALFYFAHFPNLPQINRYPRGASTNDRSRHCHPGDSKYP
jgi:hypothetical protein